MTGRPALHHSEHDDPQRGGGDHVAEPVEPVIDQEPANTVVVAANASQAAGRRRGGTNRNTSPPTQTSRLAVWPLGKAPLACAMASGGGRPMPYFRPSTLTLSTPRRPAAKISGRQFPRRFATAPATASSTVTSNGGLSTSVKSRAANPSGPRPCSRRASRSATSKPTMPRPSTTSTANPMNTAPASATIAHRRTRHHPAAADGALGNGGEDRADAGTVRR